MKYSTQIKTFESYYGEYPNDTVRGSVDMYLDEYEPKNLNRLVALVIKNHFFRLGPPCVATIDKIHNFYNFGDFQKHIEGHKSMKIPKKTVSATAPHEEPEISEEEQEEVREMIENEGGLLGMIGKQWNEER